MAKYIVAWIANDEGHEVCLNAHAAIDLINDLLDGGNAGGIIAGKLMTFAELHAEAAEEQ